MNGLLPASEAIISRLPRAPIALFAARMMLPIGLSISFSALETKSIAFAIAKPTSIKTRLT